MDTETISLEHIAEGIRHLAVPIDSLTPDPANVRTHSARNLEAIRNSLAKFRQQTPVVVDANRVVLKGNGTLAAARSLGWTHIAAITTDLSGVDRVGYAIADNRSGDAALGSLFDNDALAKTLEALGNDGFDITATGFTPAELSALLGPSSETPLPAEATGKEYTAAVADEVETVPCPHCGGAVPV